MAARSVCVRKMDQRGGRVAADQTARVWCEDAERRGGELAEGPERLGCGVEAGGCVGGVGSDK